MQIFLDLKILFTLYSNPLTRAAEIGNVQLKRALAMMQDSTCWSYKPV